MLGIHQHALILEHRPVIDELIQIPATPAQPRRNIDRERQPPQPASPETAGSERPDGR